MTVLAETGTREMLAPHDPERLNKRDRCVPPFESTKFPLGTDKASEDIPSRLIYGARTSVFISLVALGTGGVIGSSIGVKSGYYGGRVDIVLMRQRSGRDSPGRPPAKCWASRSGTLCPWPSWPACRRR